MPMTRKILVIEDNKDLARLLEIHLKDLSFEVDLAFDGIEGLSKYETRQYDLVVLDIMLPGIGGFEICREIRNQNATTPIIMLTSKSAELDRVQGLEMGADDYVTKPFSIKELMARVKALFRRIDSSTPEQTQKTGTLQIDDMLIDPQKRKVLLKNKAVDLTAKEFDLLYHFACNAGRVFTRSQLLDDVWGYGHDGYEHTVNSHINRLRAKIEGNPGNPDYILTVWGVGYRFKEIDN